MCAANKNCANRLDSKMYLYQKGLNEMKNCQMYQKQYFMPPVDCYDWVKKEQVTKAPIWCSVDLRDGNQALIEPMSLDEKLKFFELLVEVGFKEIEVGFPASSDTEYTFLRTLTASSNLPVLSKRTE